MPDYRNMTAVEALRYAKEISGLTMDQIAQGSGISLPVLRRYFQQQEGYLPGLDRIAPLCRAMKNRVILKWLLAQLATEPEKPQATSRAEALTAVARAAAALGDCQRCLAENAKITPAIAREVRSILNDAAIELESARAMLADLAAIRGYAEPLASFKKKSFAQRLYARFFRAGVKNGQQGGGNRRC